MSKAHAEHNENLCDFLIKEGKFNDWIITTAFYSSLHFVQHEIFPLVKGGVTYPNFNNYYNNILQPIGKSKHTGTKDLVKSEIPLAHPQYRWLFDACMNARYSNYAVSNPKAKQAKNNLTTLKKHLKK